MATHKWTDIKKARFSKETVDRVSRRVDKKIAAMNLAEIRKAAGKTQMDLAKITRTAQTELSQLERREDHLVSSLRKYVEALGGHLVITAEFGDHSVRLKGV